MVLLALSFALPVNRAGALDDIPRFEVADCPVEILDDPPIDCGCLVVLVVLVVLAWVRGTWSVLARAFFALLILPAIGFTVLLG